MTLKNKKILIIIGGGIAAYKSLDLIRLFKKNNNEIKTILTESGKEFVTALSLTTLTQEKVFDNLFDKNSEAEIDHISLSRWADILIVMPTTANFMAKLCHGKAEDLASTVILASNKDILLVPAMNVRMWEHKATQNNVRILKDYGYLFIGPERGEMACGEYGEGKMSSPRQIYSYVESYFNRRNIVKKRGLKALVTTGPTREYIDPVRYISNGSSGLMGFELAKKCLGLGAKVILITGPTNLKLEDGRLELIDITSAIEMFNQVKKKYKNVDIIICAAAVADYTPKKIFDKKIKKESIFKNIVFKKTVDILKYLGQNKKNQIVIGFALETDNEIEKALKKIKNKNLDAIVLNKLSSKNKCFQSKKNEIIYIEKDKDPVFHKLKDKKLVSSDIINYILNLYESNN